MALRISMIRIFIYEKIFDKILIACQDEEVTHDKGSFNHRHFLFVCGPEADFAIDLPPKTVRTYVSVYVVFG
jgi:hypothetical protein